MLQVAKFRSKGRIPGFSWCFAGDPSGPTLWRCSQPKVGVGLMGSRGNRSRDDEKLLLQIRLVNKRSQQLLILDCRSTAAAYANSLKGYGVESTAHYSNSTVRYLGIANIHTMRSCVGKLATLLQSQSTPKEGSNPDLQWLKQIEDTDWPAATRRSPPRPAPAPRPPRAPSCATGPSRVKQGEAGRAVRRL